MTNINWFENIPFLTIFLATLLSITTVLIKDGKLACRLHLVMVGIVCILSFVLCMYTFNNEVIFTYRLGNYPAPWGNELRGGVLESLMATGFTAVIFLTILGSNDFIFRGTPKEKLPIYFTMLNALVASILVLIYTNDIFTAYIFIEINTITACALVIVNGDGKSMVGILQYLVMSLIGSGLFLLGVTILYSITGHLLFPQMQEAIKDLMLLEQYEFPFLVVTGVMFIGIAIKSGLFPFHSWLPAFHPIASPPFSAIHSAVVVESYIILCIKLMFSVFTVEVVQTLKITDLLLGFGLMGMLFGSVLATRESRMKNMLAYSSVAQIGYIFMGIGLSGAIGMTAACFHILAHAVAKSMLFLCCGRFVDGAGGKKSIYYMRGLALHNPIAGVGYTVGGLSMIGVPLLAGFTSKIYFATASLYEPTRMFIVLMVLGVSMVLNALYFLPSMIAIWVKPKHEKDGFHDEEHYSFLKELHWDSSPPIFNFTIIVFIALNFVLGIWYAPVIEIIEKGIELLMQN